MMEKVSPLSVNCSRSVPAKLAALVAIFISAHTPAIANEHASPDRSDDPYLTIDPQPTIELLEEQTTLVQPDLSGDLKEADVMLDTIINMGKKVWAIVEANRPVVDVANDTASALPQGLEHWSQLSGWSLPVSRTYRVTYRNLMRLTIVDYSFRVLYTYGGNLHGKGRYLTHVTVVPADLEVLWGFKFSSKASVPSVTNSGTREAPVGGAELLVDWRVDSPLKHARSTMSFYVSGDGSFTQL